MLDTDTEITLLVPVGSSVLSVMMYLEKGCRAGHYSHSDLLVCAHKKKASICWLLEQTGAEDFISQPC